MKISNHFNRFYHGVILKEMRDLTVKDEKFLSIATNIKFRGVNFVFCPARISLETLKQLLKGINLHYPKNALSEPISTAKISNKDLMQHIEFCIRLLANNGISYKFIEDEWNRIKETY